MNTPYHEQLSKQVGRNMNTPTNHEQLTKQEAEIWTLLQTMNSSQNKRQKYEHSYKPWTTLKTRDRNMNTTTTHEQLSKEEVEIWTLLQTMKSSQNKRFMVCRNVDISAYLFWELFMVCRSVHISASQNKSCSWYVGVFIWTLLFTEPWTALRSEYEFLPLLQTMNSCSWFVSVHSLLFWELKYEHSFVTAVQNKWQKSEHSYKPWTALCSWFVGVFISASCFESCSLVQTMNSCKNKRQKYEHLQTMNSSQNKSCSWFVGMLIHSYLFWELFMVCNSCS